MSTNTLIDRLTGDNDAEKISVDSLFAQLVLFVAGDITGAEAVTGFAPPLTADEISQANEMASTLSAISNTANQIARITRIRSMFSALENPDTESFRMPDGSADYDKIKGLMGVAL